MLNSYVIDPDRHLVSAKFTGTVTLEDLEIYNTHLRADKRFSPRYSEIVNLTQVEKIDITAEQISSTGELPFLPKSKRALVVINRIQSHAAHLYRIIKRGLNIRVFTSVEEASQWINDSRAGAAAGRKR